MRSEQDFAQKRVAAIRNSLAAVTVPRSHRPAVFADLEWALEELEAAHERLDCCREQQVWRNGNAGFMAALTDGQQFNTLDEALDAHLAARDSSAKSAVESPLPHTGGASNG